MNELTGKELIDKIKKSDSKDVRELAILCGYGFDSHDVHGNKIIKARRKKFINAVIKAGGEVDLFWVNDPYESQRKYQERNKEKKAEAQKRWAEKNQEKITKLKQTPEYIEKNRKNALASYYRRKAKESAVDAVLV